MKTLHFTTLINADPKTVWDTMLNLDTYEVWTAAFAAGSTYEGSWEKGERIRFIGPDGSGISSIIEDNRPYEFVSIRHVGILNGGVEDTDSELARGWLPAFENYTLTKKGSTTEVKVDLDVTPDFEKDMQDAWPRALVALKELCERR